MRIGLLGPLWVSVNEKNATPTAPKPRRVLALLASSANRVVRNEQIIEELWENRPPASVTTTLQTYVYQLRKGLGLSAAGHDESGGPGCGGALRTFAGGYMLTLSPEELDSRQFECQVRRGRAELDAGRPDQAAQVLTSALALWRGPALVDVNPGPLLQVEVQRLEEIRRSALEARIDADLQLGRHHDIISELVEVVAQQPTNEGFQAKLMLALYRAGRRSDALRAYQCGRRALVNELGIEPSYELQHLHRLILASDTELDHSSVRRVVDMGHRGTVGIRVTADRNHRAPAGPQAPNENRPVFNRRPLQSTLAMANGSAPSRTG